MLVDYALTGTTAGYNLILDGPKFHKYGYVLILVSRGGPVGKIIGLEDIRNKKNLIAVEQTYDVGDYIEQSGTLGQVHFTFFLIEDSLSEVRNSIKEIQATVKVLDDKGNDMLLPAFDTNRI